MNHTGQGADPNAQRERSLADLALDSLTRGTADKVARELVASMPEDERRVFRSLLAQKMIEHLGTWEGQRMLAPIVEPIVHALVDEHRDSIASAVAIAIKKELEPERLRKMAIDLATKAIEKIVASIDGEVGKVVSKWRY